MNFLNDIKNKTIIITNDSNKRKILEELNKKQELLDIKFMTMEDLITNLTESYDEKSIYYIVKEYNVKPEIAKVYLNNLKYIEEKDYKSSKLKFLKKIKDKLKENNLIIKNELFKEELKDKDIILYEYKYLSNYETKIINKLKDKYNVKEIKVKKEKHSQSVYKFETQTEEVTFVLDKISYLLTNNVDINNIKIANLDNSYYKILKRMFKLYHIPIELNDKSSIIGTTIVKDFINNYNDDLSITIDYLKEKYKENDILKKIVNICNKYYFIEGNIKKELIISDIRNTNIKQEKYKNSIKEINILTDVITDDDYVFILNFNEGVIPKTYKDEDYITDNIKDEVGLEKTNILQQIEKEKTKERISSIKNCYITYKLFDNHTKYYPSNLIKEMNLEEKEGEKEKISYSKDNDEINLAIGLDEYIKYGTKDKDLDLLLNTYQNNDYNSYDNRYKKIDKETFKKSIDNKLTLSYSSLDNYSKCKFKFFLSNILKIDIFDETYYTFIGSLFHYILEKYYKESIDIDEYIEKYLKDNNIELNSKENFFLNKLTKELHFIIDTIDEQMKYTKLNGILTEKRITKEFKFEDVTITFKGFIDKVLYKEDQDKTLVALIDYKTGSQDIDLSLVPQGLSLQLPIYLYLASNSDIKNISFAGFYLQKILHNEITKSDKKTYLEQKKDNLKLMGYSSADEDILKELDISYKDSNVIKGLKQKENKEFYQTSKVLTTKEIENLINEIDKVIKEKSKEILNADFSINPKIINKENISCRYCKFKDICFVKEKDKIEIEKDIDLDYLKEEIK